MAAIEALPLVQTPEVFGLHANADISYYTSATKALWRNLVGISMTFFAISRPKISLSQIQHDYKEHVYNGTSTTVKDDYAHKPCMTMDWW